MRFLHLTLVVVISFSFLGCHQRKRDEVPVFSTAFGDIQKNEVRPGVMSILGNPKNIRYKANLEIWHYDFGNNEQSFVYFANGKVIEVKDAYGRSTLVTQEPQ